MNNGKSKRSLTGYIGLFFSGFLVGAANVIPGVSGGTMAFVLGIYEELLESIRKFTQLATWKMLLGFKLKQAYRTLPWPFLVWLLAGIAAASLLLAKPITWMLTNRLSFILAFFFGLVAASVITVLCRLGKFRIVLIPALAVGTAIGWWVAGLTEGMQSPPETWWYLVLCGAVAVCAMILPGISGSFILMLMGRYYDIMGAISGLTAFKNIGANLCTLGCFIVGIVVGLASFVQLLSWTFKRFRDLTITVLAGFMVGSLRKIWPWKVGNAMQNANTLPQPDRDFYIALAWLVAGFVLVLVIELVARRFEKKQGASSSK